MLPPFADDLPGFRIALLTLRRGRLPSDSEASSLPPLSPSLLSLLRRRRLLLRARAGLCFCCEYTTQACWRHIL